MKCYTMIWRVYGAEGHRQRESFNPSCTYDWTEGDKVRAIVIHNSDRTGTNKYSVMGITRNTKNDCLEELYGQLYDGIFENCRTGEVELLGEWAHE